MDVEKYMAQEDIICILDVQFEMFSTASEEAQFETTNQKPEIKWMMFMLLTSKRFY